MVVLPVVVGLARVVDAGAVLAFSVVDVPGELEMTMLALGGRLF